VKASWINCLLLSAPDKTSAEFWNGENQIRSYGTGSGHKGSFKVCKGIVFAEEKNFCFSHWRNDKQEHVGQK